MTINYHNKLFKVVQNSENGALDNYTVFHYQQEGNIVTCTYKGKHILSGHLLGTVNEKGEIAMVYHQVNKDGELMTGICHSTPMLLPNGKILLNEAWQWTSGDKSHGSSQLQEI